jgi:hypothetical protein
MKGNGDLEGSGRRSGQGMKHTWGKEERIYDFGGKSRRKNTTKKI